MRQVPHSREIQVYIPIKEKNDNTIASNPIDMLPGSFTLKFLTFISIRPIQCNFRNYHEKSKYQLLILLRAYE